MKGVSSGREKERVGTLSLIPQARDLFKCRTADRVVRVLKESTRPEKRSKLSTFYGSLRKGLVL